MKSRLVSMGNSRGVRLPKPLIEEAGIVDEVVLHVRDGAIVVTAAKAPRAGWAEAAARGAALVDGAFAGTGLLDTATPTRFDEEEWNW
jgi:antitoxin MazE